MRSIVQFALGVIVGLLVSANAPATEVMILGTYHMANPGRDLHNLKADDVLVDKRQRELAAVADALAKFKPTRVAVEADTDNGAPARLAKYHDYVAGTLPESRNEVVQIGYRLAKRVQLPEVYGIDVEGDFPFEAVQKFADNGHPDLAKRLGELGADVDRMLKGLDETLNKGTVSQGLRYMNEPKRIAEGNAFYSTMLLYGAGNEQPGAALLTAWQGRNNQICARLVQLAKANDRVVVLYGSGHAYLLRRCVQEMPGYKLIEPNDYLPAKR
jgi:hypothetical protein